MYDDDIEIARKNHTWAEMKDRMMNSQMDGSMNYKNYMQNETDKLHYGSQTSPITIFNPYAWAQFIEAWKEGKFKRKKKEKY